MDHLVRWFWIPRWDIQPGRTSRQHLIAYPACNLVVEADAAALFGPATRASHRDLAGTGWAVGALLRPAAVPHFTADPGALRDTSVAVDAPELVSRVRASMPGGLQDAVDAFTAWLAAVTGPPSAEALLANAMTDLIDADPEVRTVEDAAARLSVSVRTLQRLAARYVGLPPLAMIRRRRLQEAAARLRADPAVTLAEVAADLGYSDHAHLANEFRAVLGLTLSRYRREVL
ncbi:AraC family transcriptional regulator [Couchioplanes azureus]|uniref:AraC family transcriptional regulator n=1 Tax=Couchioplanes caeruleus TaxID=56438 RepID=UPI001E29FF5A|nr:helix-turn-helix domain-containing protein [Couchioplanes caeruleus]